jgi:hypothetical protein
MTDYTVSIRQSILSAIQAAFQAVQPPNTSAPGYTPSDADWPFAFSTVAIGPLSDQDQRKAYSLGIVAGQERETFNFPYINCKFQIALEFRATANQDSPAPGILAEQVLTVVKRVTDNNKTWGGLAIDTKRVGNEIDLTTYLDRSVVGVVYIEVQYRTAHFDPRQLTPDAGDNPTL